LVCYCLLLLGHAPPALRLARTITYCFRAELSISLGTVKASGTPISVKTGGTVSGRVHWPGVMASGHCLPGG
jgi:hypothetical protein